MRIILIFLFLLGLYTSAYAIPATEKYGTDYGARICNSDSIQWVRTYFTDIDKLLEFLNTLEPAQSKDATILVGEDKLVLIYWVYTECTTLEQLEGLE